MPRITQLPADLRAVDPNVFAAAAPVTGFAAQAALSFLAACLATILVRGAVDDMLHHQ